MLAEKNKVDKNATSSFKEIMKAVAVRPHLHPQKPSKYHEEDMVDTVREVRTKPYVTFSYGLLSMDILLKKLWADTKCSYED